MYESTIESTDAVGSNTIAITVSTPDGFEAEPGQFVLFEAEIDGAEETGYYTISSPEVTDSFEITVAVDPDGTLGPWLADRPVGATLQFDGPYGEVEYTGGGDVAVLAAGPGIGPAVGIGERALATDHDVVIGYEGEDPPHEERIRAIGDGGGEIVIEDEIGTVISRTDSLTDGRTIYVFGFSEFVEAARDGLKTAGIPSDVVEIENFGPA